MKPTFGEEAHSVRNSTFNEEGIMKSDENHDPRNNQNKTSEESRLIAERTLLVEEIKQLSKFVIDKMSKEDTTAATLQASLEFLAVHSDKLNRINEKIWNEMFDINQLRRDRQEQNTLNLETRFIVCQLREAIDKRKTAKGIHNSSDHKNPVGADQKCCGSSKNARKLEHLKMDRFDGKLENWLPWWARFEDRIQNDPQLNDRSKYDYLLQYLSREVKERLKTIPVDEEFYQTAVDRLKAEFGNVDKLRALYTQRLMTLKPIANRYDRSGLRELLQVVHTSIAALERIGLPRDSITPFFYPKLKESVPVDVYLEFKISSRIERANAANGTSASTIISTEQLDKLLTFIKDVVSDLDDINEQQLKQLQTSGANRTVPSAFALKTELKTVHKKSTPFRTPTSAEQVHQSPCVFCKSAEHRTQACLDTSMSIQKKREMLTRENRCSTCSKRGHQGSSCRSSPFCIKCKQRGHMTPLCSSMETFAGHCQKEASATDEKQYYITVRAMAIGPSGKKREVRILFDSGSKVSFARNQVVEQLGFDRKKLDTIPISLKMLKQATILTETSAVSFRLQHVRGGPANHFKFFTLDNICGGQIQPEIDATSEEQLQRMNIALSDNYNSKEPIDILIGADQLVGVQTHNAHRLGKTLELVETAFGWALFGARNGKARATVDVNFAETPCLLTSVPQMTPLEPRPDFEQRVRMFIEADAMAIENEPREEADQFINEFMEKVKFDPKNHRFTVALPFKDGLQPGKNLSIATARLKALTKSLDRRGLRQKYQTEVQSLLDLNFIEPVDENQRPVGPVSYLPHREVVKEESLTTKLRIVFDASAKEKGFLSLNDTLHQGWPTFFVPRTTKVMATDPADHQNLGHPF
ncbi:uncharacterized protein LOC100907340 [Galendromus occidentalis]|uniref:Uncharacterized protein LOC100907340 n=1 Tax=Galendromus occidentalis TaxID=34638 RepID=A0AAJ6W106_9ACAR|nr:uncharacterized protein LOC100907340 [Galendromus occidentalis]